jgi:hypothetical protein
MADGHLTFAPIPATPHALTLAAIAFRTMKTIIIILFGLVSLGVYGQITNTTRRDATNIYYNALDSAVKIIQTKIKPKTLIVEGDVYAVNRLPNSISGIGIIIKEGQDIQKKIKEGTADAIVTLNRLEIDHGDFRILIQLWTIENGQRRILDNGASVYIFNYEYLPADKSFRLMRIDKSIPIR